MIDQFCSIQETASKCTYRWTSILVDPRVYFEILDKPAGPCERNMWNLSPLQSSVVDYESAPFSAFWPKSKANQWKARNSEGKSYTVSLAPHFLQKGSLLIRWMDIVCRSQSLQLSSKMCSLSLRGYEQSQDEMLAPLIAIHVHNCISVDSIMYVGVE